MKIDTQIHNTSMIIENEQESKVPPKKSFYELMIFPFNRKNLIKTIIVFIITYWMFNDTSLFIFGVPVAVFIILTYGSVLIRKALNIEETWRSDVYWLRFIEYAAIVNICIMMFVVAIPGLVNNGYNYIPDFITDNFMLINSFILVANMYLWCFFFITFALVENRPVWTLIKYFKKLCVYNFISFMAALLIIKTTSMIIANMNDFQLFLVINHILILYLTLITMLSWTKFLYDDYYPAILPEKETEEVIDK